MPEFGASQGSVEDLRQGLFLSNSHFVCVQLRCNNVCCPVDENFVFLIIGRQQCSFPAWLVFLGSSWLDPSWHMVLVFLGCLPPPLDDEGLWSGIVSHSPRPTRFSAFCIGSLRGIMPSGWSPARHNLFSAISPHSFYPHSLCVDHETQGVAAVAQICIALDTYL